MNLCVCVCGYEKSTHSHLSLCAARSMLASFVWSELSAVALIALKEEDEEKKTTTTYTHTNTLVQNVLTLINTFFAQSRKKK